MRTRRGETRWRAAAALACMLLGALALAPASQGAGAQASIVNGKAASIAEFPSLAYIEAHAGKDSFSCTGTVVAPRVVLTAGHCVEDPETGRLTPAKKYFVATGVSNPSKAAAENVFRVVEARAFPDFDPGALRRDAALLILAAPTTAPPLPIAGPADAGLYSGGATVQLAGWGLTKAGASQPPANLRATTTTVQGTALCQSKTHSYYPPFSPAIQLCTLPSTKKKSGGCFGDSGGPAIGHRLDGSPVELGIISTGAPGCNPKLPNVLTRADLVAPWVGEWIAAAEASAPRPVVDPRAPLPKMSEETGEELSAFTLLNGLGQRFERAKEVFGSCRRAGKSSYRCEIDWFTGRDAYASRVSVTYVRRQETVSWDGHFQVRWARLSCLRSSGDHCAIHSKHG